MIELDASHHSYVDQAVIAACTVLLAEINGKSMVIKAEF